MGRLGGRRKELLDDHKEKRRYWKLKEDTPDRIFWRSRFGRGCRLVVRHYEMKMNVSVGFERSFFLTKCMSF